MTKNCQLISRAWSAGCCSIGRSNCKVFFYIFDFTLSERYQRIPRSTNLAGDPDYSLLFYIADGLSVLVVLLISRLDVDVERMESGNFAAGVKRLVRLIDVDVFIFMMLLLGTCWGFIESFMFVFLMELKANSYLLGNRKSEKLL